MKQQLKRLPSILIGNALLAFAICAFVVPHGFMLGGSNGIALFLQNFVDLPLSVLNGVLNTALFLLGLACMGKEFAATALLSTIVYPLIMAVLENLPVATLFAGEDRLVCALFCAVIAGLGIGIVIRTGGSTGGMDIPPIILNKYKGIPVGTSLMIIDTATVLAQVFFKGLDGLLYSVLIIALISITINQTVVSGESKVQIIIISPLYDSIRQEILRSQDCGATMLSIETGLNHEPQKAILSVVYAKKYPAIRDAALRLDPKAFIIATDVKNVNGRGYTLSRTPEE